MGEGATTVASIVDVFAEDAFTSVGDSIGSAFLQITNFITSEPLLMFGLTFAAVSGLVGLTIKVSRRLGLKPRR